MSCTDTEYSMSGCCKSVRVVFKERAVAQHSILPAHLLDLLPNFTVCPPLATHRHQPFEEAVKPKQLPVTAVSLLDSGLNLLCKRCVYVTCSIEGPDTDWHVLSLNTSFRDPRSLSLFISTSECVRLLRYRVLPCLCVYSALRLRTTTSPVPYKTLGHGCVRAILTMK